MSAREAWVREEAARRGIQVRRRPSGAWELKGRGFYLLTRDLRLVSRQDFASTAYVEQPRL